MDCIQLAEDRSGGGLCEHSDEPSGPIKGREFIE
jgi:hypothetical protein